MYNEKIIERVNNLTYLGALKNANVTMLSKPNEFSDVVKFFVQININDVIQKISFKATGCTTFMAMCSYFCELIENKTIEEALKISKENFEEIIVLPESKTHVYQIILNTFALLVKKYRKGIEKGTIKPCEIVGNQQTEEKKATKSNSNKVNLNIGLDEILYNENTSKKKIKKLTQEDVEKINKFEETTHENSKNTDNKENYIEEDLNTINEEIVTIESQMPLEQTIIIEEPAIKPQKKISKIKQHKVTESPKIEVVNENIVSQVPNESISQEVIRHEVVVKQETITKEENNQALVETQVQKEVIRTVEVKKTISENQANHLLALQSKVNRHNQEVRKEKSETNTKNLNSMLAKLHKSEGENLQTKDVNSIKKDISLLQKEIANLKNKNEASLEQNSVQDKPEIKIEPKKEKKSLFSWFSRKK